MIRENRETRLRDLRHTVLGHVEELDADLTTLLEEFTDVFKEDQVESIVEAIHSVKRRITLATLPDDAAPESGVTKKLKVTPSHESDSS